MGIGRVQALQLPAADGDVHHELLFDGVVVTEPGEWCGKNAFFAMPFKTLKRSFYQDRLRTTHKGTLRTRGVFCRSRSLVVNAADVKPAPPAFCQVRKHIFCAF